MDIVLPETAEDLRIIALDNQDNNNNGYFPPVDEEDTTQTAPQSTIDRRNGILQSMSAIGLARPEENLERND